ncbi:hypothetical protein PPERSA_01152 [Pseudocohnilembus persalinus]|uniref:Palmitoyltransferase n=1 Tax=Pseudocohnilembus persalinus TaxID=266149 RepID=A0A0V0QVI2_PSEPJ|nr:hypothetical protein PPERSA_01152 [Pseudocohnilembus persalinus]|eukprot:KRX06074.1 hypothetical protein PPERSA_01152 [Pseudocohnilembus persalinus]
MEYILNIFMRSIGSVLVIFLYLLVGLVYYASCFEQIRAYYIYSQSLLFALTLLVVLTFVCFNVIFNFTLCILVGPGTTKDLQEKYQKYNFPDLDQCSDEELRIIKNRGQFNICKKCRKVKPLRAHHCSVCNTCVLKMDHHCPWINGCVGFNNHRYFLLFLLYLTFGTGFISTLMFYTNSNDELYQIQSNLNSKIYQVITVLVPVIFVVLIFFTGWNWYLALKGNTAIEFWGQKREGYDSDQKQQNFGSQYVLDNLYLIFGIKSKLKIFYPSIRELPVDGITWQINDSDSQNYGEEKSLYELENTRINKTFEGNYQFNRYQRALNDIDEL